MFSENVPFYGYMIINGDDKNIKKISKRISRTQITYGKSKKCTYQIKNIVPDRGKQDFEILDSRNKKIHKFKINLPGEHNVLNSMAAVTLGLEMGLSFQTIKRSIFKYSGVKISEVSP